MDLTQQDPAPIDPGPTPPQPVSSPVPPGHDKNEPPKTESSQPEPSPAPATTQVVVSSQQPPSAAVTKPSVADQAKVTRKASAILVLGRFQCTYFAADRVQPVTFQLPHDVVNDLEVLSDEKLNTYINQIVTQNHLTSSILSFILADDILFSKIIMTPDPKVREDEIQSFIDTVPYEDPAITKVVTVTATTVGVSNREYFEAFKNAFQKLGFTIELIVPAFLFGKEINLAKDVSVTTLTLALHRVASYHQYNLDQKVVLPQPSQPLTIQHGIPKDKTRLYILSGVFGLMVLVLVILIYTTMRPKPKPPVRTLRTAPVVKTVSPSPTPSPVASPAGTITSVQSVRISYVTAQSAKATAMKTILETLGIKQVALQRAGAIGGSGSLVVFSQKVPQAERETIISELQKVDTGVRVQESPTATTDILITLLQ